MMKATDVPVLFTTYNRLDFTKKSLKSLLNSTCGDIYVFDNNSSDGTIEWLRGQKEDKLILFFNDKNEGISGSMNYFFKKTKNKNFVAKIDNDTIVPPDWLERLLAVAIDFNIDVVQAKHPIYKLSHPSGDFDKWMKTKRVSKKNEKLFYSDHVGGSGVVIRRSSIKEELSSKRLLGGWDELQKKIPNNKKAFFAGTELEILDIAKGQVDLGDYQKYYEETGRIYMAQLADQKEWIEHLERDIRGLNKEIEAMRSDRPFRLRDRLALISKKFKRVK